MFVYHISLLKTGFLLKSFAPHMPTYFCQRRHDSLKACKIPRRNFLRQICLHFQAKPIRMLKYSIFHVEWYIMYLFTGNSQYSCILIGLLKMYTNLLIGLKRNPTLFCKIVTTDKPISTCLFTKREVSFTAFLRHKFSISSYNKLFYNLQYFISLHIHFSTIELFYL